eukprot:TRINITY_DN6385_c0_g2_i4.p4 TRINITY_DN6385_c0_g2~~TRINITY_DN6385_c0_g2_i4.p4  ORF type:complete len:191 (-),score=-13.84 TRINITY_DN6385_c0_g2_i4:932-1504(-)
MLWSAQLWQHLNGVILLQFQLLSNRATIIIFIIQIQVIRKCVNYIYFLLKNCKQTKILQVARAQLFSSTFRGVFIIELYLGKDGSWFRVRQYGQISLQIENTEICVLYFNMAKFLCRQRTQQSVFCTEIFNTKLTLPQSVYRFYESSIQFLKKVMFLICDVYIINLQIQLYSNCKPIESFLHNLFDFRFS